MRSILTKPSIEEVRNAIAALEKLCLDHERISPQETVEIQKRIGHLYRWIEFTKTGKHAEARNEFIAALGGEHFGIRHH